MALTGEEFNAAAEAFYRERLKKEQMAEAMEVWSAQVRQMDSMTNWRNGQDAQALFSLLQGSDAADFVDKARPAVVAENSPLPTVTQLIHLMLLTLNYMKRQTETVRPEA
jgi:hypothetical protein